MLDRLLKFEEQLVRVEAALLVMFVLMMLGLATYNVFYRNVLVPMQVNALTTAAQEAKAAPAQATGETAKEEATPDDSAGGFGGGFGDDDEDGAGGFGGGFGDDGDDAAGFGGGFGEQPAEEDEPPADPVDDTAGFGGDFGDPDEEGGDGSEDDPAGGFGGGFGGDFDDANAVPVVQVAPQPTAEVKVPWLAKVVDAVKLEWIDVLLRQLVLVVGFLGAMIAAQRRKHITIDALSKVLPERVNRWVSVFTSSLSVFVCLVLAVAGIDLVKISLEFPKELMSWADEWHFQLAFPLGFGLLAFHFAIRVFEGVMYATGKVEPPDDYEPMGGVI